jgi:hypothetical protein
VFEDHMAPENTNRSQPRAASAQEKRLAAVERLAAQLALDMEHAKTAAIATERQAKETAAQSKETHDMVQALNNTFMVKRPGDDAPLADQIGRMVRDYDRSKFTARVIFAIVLALPLGAIATWFGINRGS